MKFILLYFNSLIASLAIKPKVFTPKAEANLMDQNYYQQKN